MSIQKASYILGIFLALFAFHQAHVCMNKWWRQISGNQNGNCASNAFQIFFFLKCHKLFKDGELVNANNLGSKRNSMFFHFGWFCKKSSLRKLAKPSLSSHKSHTKVIWIILWIDFVKPMWTLVWTLLNWFCPGLYWFSLSQEGIHLR